MTSKIHTIYFAVIVVFYTLFSFAFPQTLYLTLPLVLAIACLTFSCKPTDCSLYIFGGLCLLGLLVSYIDATELIWMIALGIWGFMSLIDLIFLLFKVKFTAERSLPGRFAQGEYSKVSLKINNLSSTGYQVRLFDGLPSEAICEQMPYNGFVPGSKFMEVEYATAINERGITTFKKAFIECFAPFKLWSRTIRVGEIEEVRVYPNYEPVLQLALLSMENNPEQMGIVKKNKVGLSKEFHQLRDYHEGDTLSQIDWKASSKRQSLISRSYHEQRDQNLILAIDCGRRMRALDGDISQFDHCLNAMLLLAYVALKQGDNVGVMAYGGSDRWLPPVKGVNSMTTILNHLFDYKTTEAPSDYSEAVERLMVNQKRRSMVVFISNFRGEDAKELIDPLRRIRQRHILCLGNIREQEVDEVKEQQVTSFNEAIQLAAIEKYLSARKDVMTQLNSYNIPSVDVTAVDLPVALANQYLALREMV